MPNIQKLSEFRIGKSGRYIQECKRKEEGCFSNNLKLFLRKFLQLKFFID